MLQGQMLPRQMSPRQLPIHADDLNNQTSKFGSVLTSNIKDIAAFLLLNYRDPNKKNKNTSLAAPGALAHRLQRRTAFNAAPPASGPQNGRRGLERCLPLGFGALPSTFAK